MGLFNKNKPFKFYSLTNKIEGDYNLNLQQGNIRFYTISDNELDCWEYLDKMLYYKNREHFNSWKEYHLNEFENESDAWECYRNNTLEEEIVEKYMIHELFIPKQNLASIMRMFTECIPLDCSFIKPVEFEVFKEHHPTTNTLDN